MAKEHWLHAKSDNFEMFSSASEKESRRILEKLEQFRAFFVAALPLRRVREPKTFVVVFDSDRTFRDYKPRYKGRPQDVAGYCAAADDEAIMALTTDTDPDLEDDGDATRIVMHEFVHLMLHTRGVNPPIWLNEGLAELFCTFEVDDNQVILGRPKDVYVEYLSNSAIPSLRSILTTTRKSKAYNDEDEAPIFYATSWALTHYFICGPDPTNREKLARFLATQDEAMEGEDPVRNFERAFGITAAQMQTTLRDYLNGGRYRLRVAKLPRPDLAKQIAFRPATDFELEMMLLDVKSRGAGVDTSAEALALAEKHPDSPRPHELLAAIYTDLDRSGDALVHWRRAAELHSENPYVYVRLARETLALEEVKSLVCDRRSQAVVDQLRGWVDQALAINPDSADALEALALTEAAAPQIRIAAVNRVQAAVSRIKDPAPTLLALGIVRLRLGDPKTAAHIADVVIEDRKASKAVVGAAKDLRARALAATTAPVPPKAGETGQ